MNKPLRLSEGLYRLPGLSFDKSLDLTRHGVSFMLGSLALIIQGAGIQEAAENLITGVQYQRPLGDQVSHDC